MIGTEPQKTAPPRGRRAAIAVGVLAVIVAALAGAVALWSGITLTTPSTVLARAHVQPLGGSIQSATATTTSGRRIPIRVNDGRIMPTTLLAPGERVTVDVVVRPPGLLRWVLGKTRDKRITLQAPRAHFANRWITTGPGSSLSVTFDQPVDVIAYGTAGAPLRRRVLDSPRHTVEIPRGSTAVAGSVQVAAASRSWERTGSPSRVSWFPHEQSPVTVVSPLPGTKISPGRPITLTFSQPLSKVLGAQQPSLSSGTTGRWHEQDSHTLVFTPTGLGAGFATTLRLTLPERLMVAGPGGGALHRAREIAWTIPPGSTLRLQQLLAEAGYLPNDWTAAGDDVAKTTSAQLDAAITAPAGSFHWRYSNTPPELQSLWQAGSPNVITRGAVMMYQQQHDLAVDGVAGHAVWQSLIADAIAGRRRTAGYSYVYVHRGVPQHLTLWHDGHTVLRSPGNTGVPAAPTKLGTFPVFEHIAVGTMSGTNPDGTKYHDPGIKWISYFNGGDALHSFTRASFGTPQSLGCVELPLAAAAKVWPYTPIGTLVTIEQ